jgi:hypothetical protein
MRGLAIVPRWYLVLIAGMLLLPIRQTRADTNTIYKKLLQSTGWINCPQPGGGNSWGTCWVCNKQERLVITNKHVVDKAASIVVDFPLFRGGKLLTLVNDYLQTSPLKGKVIAFDEKRDLALCQLEALRDGIEALPLAAQPAKPGNKIFSLGNSSANSPKKDAATLWRFGMGHVELRYFDVVTFQKPPAQKVEATTLRCSVKTAGGDSGGPVVDTSGELVAVQSNADGFNSFSIDVDEVRIFLDRSRATRRPPVSLRELTGTWTVATTDELGRCYWSLTVRPDGGCLFERDESYEGSFVRLNAGAARMSLPGLNMRGEVALRWANDDQFSFTLHGLDYTATRR